MQLPADPVLAATHPDPYPYYARVVAERPFHFDDSLGYWVAAGASVVDDVLASDLCRVRPRDEPVPGSVASTPVGDVYRHMIRMTDGPAQAYRKQAATAAFSALPDATVRAAARASARRLVDELSPAQRPEQVTTFAFHLPVHVTARLLGFEPEWLDRTADDVERFIRALTPDSTPAERLRGAASAEGLIDRIERVRCNRSLLTEESLLAHFELRLVEAGERDQTALAVNAIGFLMQSYEATAGLIGNTLVALAAGGGRAGGDLGGKQLDHPFIQEVARFDAPVQNTRRFVAEDGIIAGHSVKAGDAILVLLAAANRDPAVNSHPHLFDPGRRDAKIYTFGAGSHRCPGAMLATTIALEGVRALLAAGCSPESLVSRMTYRAAPNVRIPVFHA